MATGTKFKLTYFNLTGRGEVARILFSLAGVDFEDIRIEKDKEWPALKPKTPFGTLPLLEIDNNVVLCQSHAINGYLARRFGYGGKTALEQAQVDMMVGCVADFFNPVVQNVLLNRDKESANKFSERYKKEILPGYLAKFETFLSQNASGSGYLVGDGLTVADVYFMERLLSLGPRIGYEADLSSFPRVAALKEKYISEPKVIAWKAKGHPKDARIFKDD